MWPRCRGRQRRPPHQVTLRPPTRLPLKKVPTPRSTKPLSVRGPRRRHPIPSSPASPRRVERPLGPIRPKRPWGWPQPPVKRLPTRQRRQRQPLTLPRARSLSLQRAWQRPPTPHRRRLLSPHRRVLPLPRSLSLLQQFPREVLRLDSRPMQVRMPLPPLSDRRPPCLKAPPVNRRLRANATRPQAAALVVAMQSQQRPLRLWLEPKKLCCRLPSSSLRAPPGRTRQRSPLLQRRLQPLHGPRQ